VPGSPFSPWLFAVVALFVAWPQTTVAQAGPVQRTERIAAELAPMSAWATPGSTVIVAVRQDIEPGWHTYWRNPGDSGGATELTWTLPPGTKAGEIIWPLPERQRLQSLMNYGYSGEAFLPTPIEIPADIPVGGQIPISVRALFMVCSDQMCVPDELTLTLSLPVRNGPAPLAVDHGAAIQAVVQAAPRPGALQARLNPGAQGLMLSVTGDELAGRNPGWAWFFPYRGGVIDHPSAQPGQYGPDGLSLALTAGRAAAGGLTGPIEGVLATELGAWEVSAEVGDPLAGVTGQGALRDPEKTSNEGGVLGFLHAVLFAFLGGLILNLMPCVFPILAMKAAALTRSAHEPSAARRDGLAFLTGVLASFLVLAGGLLALRAGGQALGWGFQLQSPAVIAGLALLMLAVALNLSGVYHVGAGLQAAAGQGPLSRLPGGAGAFGTGVLAVVVAAPCTAPFMAFALGAALVMPTPMALAVFLALGLGLALPYVMISLSPGLMARLPRPGPWMQRLQGLLAFPMYGAGLWLIWVFSRQTGAEALALLLAAALSLAFALWLWGRVQADRAQAGRGTISLAAGAIVLVGALALTVLAVRLPLPSAAEPGAVDPIAAAPWSPEAVAAAQGQGQIVLVNFTADWCVTCKLNEGAALSSSSVRAALDESGAVYLVGDWTRRDAAIAAELERHGRSGVPLYLVYAPGQTEPRILPQLLTPGLVIRALNEAGAASSRPET
jgi:thiol:disulfide interchange protein